MKDVLVFGQDTEPPFLDLLLTTTMDQFRLQILSDLHLEVERPDEPLYAYDFPASAPNLALLGDIGWTRDDRLFDWLRAQLARFETVFFVCGNHEPYGVDATVKDSMDRLQSFQQSSSGKFIVLDRTRFDVSPTLTILGCTLWSALDPDCLDILSWSLTDFKRIHGFDAAFYNTLHQTDLAWLCESVEAFVATNLTVALSCSLTTHPLLRELVTQSTLADQRTLHLPPSLPSSLVGVHPCTCGPLDIPIGAATLSGKVLEYMPTNVAMALVLQILILAKRFYCKGARRLIFRSFMRKCSGSNTTKDEGPNVRQVINK